MISPQKLPSNEAERCNMFAGVWTYSARAAGVIMKRAYRFTQSGLHERAFTPGKAFSQEHASSLREQQLAGDVHFLYSI